MPKIFKTAFFVCAFSAICQTANGGLVYNIALNTAPLVGHAAGPFYIELTFTDGSGVGDANNTVTMSNINFGGGSALGCPLIFGGAGDSLETSVTITDGSINSLFSEQFAHGLLLSFSLMLTSNDDAGGALDGFTLFLLDSSGVPLPTMAPFGDYLLGADLSSTGPNFNVYGIDPNRPLTGGNAVSIAAPTITLNSVPEPSTIYLIGSALGMMLLVKLLFFVRHKELLGRPSVQIATASKQTRET